jgi:hypothetical protein
MLTEMFGQGGGIPSREAAMNIIQSNSAAVREIVSSRSEAASASKLPRRQGHSPDQALMYAWSIGTTRAAQDRTADLPVPQREECPPEVYIG